MSNFTALVRNKETGDFYTASFYDDYFGRHRYGIEVEGKILTEDEFDRHWQRVPDVDKRED